MLEITEKEFQLLKSLMHERTGVFLRQTKKALVISRLRKRLGELRINSFTDYYKLLTASGSREVEHFVNAITTNETFFLRGESHFKFLKEVVLPDVLKAGNRYLKIWSAACSSGEEPYSIAITLLESLLDIKRLGIKIFASDINSEVLTDAQEGVYGENKFKVTPPSIKQKYFTEVKGGKAAAYKIKDSVKKLVIFKPHNLKRIFTERDLDVVFLRNVMIYFDKATKLEVIENVAKSIKPGGYLFLGHSESMFGFEKRLNFQYVIPSIFFKR